MTSQESFDPRSSLFSIYDAVHGTVDLRGTMGTEGVGTIVQLLNSPMVERLRRIKQLGYASHSYPAADHSRYAHAIGTMNMMRAILNRLISEQAISTKVFSDLRTCFPTVFRPRRANGNLDALIRHMLVAALLQDVGELPYGQATGLVYKPADNLRKHVWDEVGFEINDWPDKDIFTVAYIHERQHSELLQDLSIDLPFLVFLITGRTNDPKSTQLSGLRQLRHMLDGEVDADRLDYVHRDAYHTVGGVVSTNALIESLLYYDDIGPVFSDAGPVSDFLVLRAHLWTTVYFSPQNRFRMLLLITLLEGIREDEECAKWFFGESYNKGLMLVDFERIDDVSLTARISALYDGTKKNGLKQQAQNALRILAGQGPEYNCFWLPRPELEAKQNVHLVLPDDLFFDTYSNYQDHLLYKPGSVRVEAERFKYISNPIPLEYCCGAFSPTFTEQWSALPMPGNILLFLPRNRKSGGWRQFDKAIQEGVLYGVLKKEDPLLPRFPADTRNIEGFSGPNIFISFNWADVKIVERIARSLYKRRRRYYLLYDPYQGIGDDTGSNSINAVQQADEIIVLVSANYVKRYEEEAEGNIHKEIIEMCIRFKQEHLKPVFLSAEQWEEIKGKLPYDELGYTYGPPYVGMPLRTAPGSMVEEAITKALEKIDEELRAKPARK